MSSKLNLDYTDGCETKMKRRERFKYVRTFVRRSDLAKVSVYHNGGFGGTDLARELELWWQDRSIVEFSNQYLENEDFEIVIEKGFPTKFGFIYWSL